MHAYCRRALSDCGAWLFAIGLCPNRPLAEVRGYYCRTLSEPPHDWDSSSVGVRAVPTVSQTHQNV